VNTGKKIKVYLASPDETDLVSDDLRLGQKFIQHNFDNARAIQATSANEADIIIIFQGWSFKLPEYADQLCVDPLIQNYAHKVYVVNYDSTVREGFFPGCYVSLQKSHYDPKRFVPCAYPKVYNEFIDDSLISEPTKYLLSFRGTLHSHEVRGRMFNDLKHAKNSLMIDNTKVFHSHTAHEKKTYLKQLAQSQFVLCPRGTSPNSYRLFETMQLGRCPVIISDQWVPPNGPTWADCSIQIDESNTSKVESILNQRQHEAEFLGANARAVWEAYFCEEKIYQSYLDNIIDLFHADTCLTKSFEEYQTYWRSKSFLHKNDWSLSQKLMRRLKFWT